MTCGGNALSGRSWPRRWICKMAGLSGKRRIAYCSPVGKNGEVVWVVDRSQSVVYYGTTFDGGPKTRSHILTLCS